MALELVRLKLAIQRRALGGAGLGQRIGFIAGWLVALVLGVAAGHALGVRAVGAPGGNGELLVLIVLTVVFLGWVFGPIVMPGLGDQTVDPARLEMFPLTPREQVRGLLLGGLVAPTSLFTLLVAAGGTFAAGHALGERVAVLLAAVVFVVLCVACSRAVQALMAGVLNSRRGRDVVILVAALLGLGIYLLTQNVHRLVEAVADAQSSGLQSVLGWLPPGGLGRARFAAAEGGWGEVLVHLLIALVLVVAAIAVWEWAIRRRVEGKYATERAARRTDSSGTTLALPPFPVNAVAPSALTAAMSQQLRYFFFRSPQALQTAVMALVMGVLVGHSTAGEGDAAGLMIGALGMALLLCSLVVVNIFGWDDRGFSSMLVSGAPWRTVLVGKALTWPIVATAVMGVFILVEAALHANWSGAFPAFLAGLALIVVSMGLGAMISVRHPQNRVQRTGSAMGSVLAFVEYFGGVIVFGTVAGVLWVLLKDGLPDAVLGLGGVALAALAAVAMLGSAGTRLERDPWRVEALLTGDPVPPPPPVLEREPAAGWAPIRSYLDWACRGRSSVGTYVKGLALILLVWQGVGGVLAVLLRLFTGWTADDGQVHAMLLQDAPFVIAFFATPFLVAWVNRRPWFSIGMPRLETRWGQFALGVAASVIGLAAAALLTSPWWPVEFSGFDWGQLVPAALVGSVLILLQAGFEEQLFRGYLMQFVRRVVDSPVLVVGVPAVVFALLHIGNLKAYGGNPLVLVPYLTMGLAFGWAAWRSGSLWLPLGMHWANNLAGVILLGLLGDVLPTVAPFVRDIATAPAWLLAANSLVSFTTNVLIIRWVLRRQEAATVGTSIESDTPEPARIR